MKDCSLILPILEVPNSANDVLLGKLSPRDEKWDGFKRQAVRLSELFEMGGYDSYARRMNDCGNFLEFITAVDEKTGEERLRLKSAHFCHVARCPICQWRRTLMWRSKAFQMMPMVFKDYPTARYVFLTLTVQNCHVSELRSTLAWMNKAWERLSKRKQFPAIGWLKSVEVTREHQCISKTFCATNKIQKPCNRCMPMEYVHPHFHCLLMVPASYFGKAYLTQEQWTEFWKKSLRVDYTPVVDIRAVKSLTNANQGMLEAVLETFKYTVKPQDILTGKENVSMSDQQFLTELTAQLHKTKAIATGGILKQYLKDLEKEPEDLIHTDLLEDDEFSKSASLFAKWDEHIKHYRINLL